MREHLFRGKTEKGEWVEGSLIRTFNDETLENVYEILYEVLMQEDEDWPLPYMVAVRKRVIPETVGEWSGKTDNSPQKLKIFEKDIVSTNCGMFKVIFRDGMFELTNQNEDSYVSFWQVENIKVVGNIHDNPELLEVKQ